MKKQSKLYLEDILVCIQRIRIVADKGQDTFYRDFILQDSIVRNFTNIGEALKQIDPELLEGDADFSWKGYVRFRDVLVHQYDTINMVTVWTTVQEELTPLEERIKALLAKLDQKS